MNNHMFYKIKYEKKTINNQIIPKIISLLEKKCHTKPENNTTNSINIDINDNISQYYTN